MCFPIVCCAAQYRRFGSRPVRRMRMEGGKELSMTQLMALVWLADLAPAAREGGCRPCWPCRFRRLLAD